MAIKKGLLGMLLLMLIIFMAIAVSGCSEKQTGTEEHSEKHEDAKFYPKTKPSAVAGQQIYKSKCATCHGETGGGDGETASKLKEKPKDFTKLSFMRREAPQEFYEAITDGKESMPKFKKSLTEAQRWDALFYVWSLATSPMQIEDGKRVYEKHCEACHGENGDGQGVASKGLKKQPKNLDDPKFMMKEDGNEFFEKVTKGDKPMPAFEKKLTVDERRNAVDYTWTFVYEPAVQ